MKKSHSNHMLPMTRMIPSPIKILCFEDIPSHLAACLLCPFVRFFLRDPLRSASDNSLTFLTGARSREISMVPGGAIFFAPAGLLCGAGRPRGNRK